MNTIAAASIPVRECFICAQEMSESDSKRLDCCRNVIHNQCWQTHIDHGGQNCVFCSRPIIDIPTQMKAQNVMQKAFNKRCREEEENLTGVVRSMYNPWEAEIDLQVQMDGFLNNLLNRADSLVDKKRLWGEFVKQILNPASQLGEGWTAEDLDEEFSMWMALNIDEILPFLGEEPFVISRDILQSVAQSLLDDNSLSNQEKKEAWETFFQKYSDSRENCDVIQLFVADYADEFPYLNNAEIASDGPSKKKTKKSESDADI